MIMLQIEKVASFGTFKKEDTPISTEAGFSMSDK